jgi:hypothetical protein
MAFIPASNVLQVNFIQAMGNVQVQNVQYWRHGGAIDQAAADALGAALVAWWDVEFSATLTTELQLNALRMQDLTTDVAPVYEYTTGLPVTGQHAVPALPPFVAFCISLRTANRGRSGRGRQYVAGLREDQASGNTYAQGAAQALVDAYMELVNFPPTGWEWGVLSRQNNGVPRTQGLFQPITAVIYTDLTLDTQRGRRF